MPDEKVEAGDNTDEQNVESLEASEAQAESYAPTEQCSKLSWAHDAEKQNTSMVLTAAATEVDENEEKYDPNSVSSGDSDAPPAAVQRPSSSRQCQRWEGRT